MVGGRLGEGEREMEWPNDKESNVVSGWSLVEREGLEKKSCRIVAGRVWSEAVKEGSWREERLISFQTSS